MASSAQASVIGVGLSWRSGVYAQEVWRKGEPHYLLANLGNKDVDITVHVFDSSWRLGQPLPKAAAGPWKVPAGKQTLVSGKALKGENLWRWVIGGNEPIGVLPSVSDPGYKGEGYASAQGLNGSGGSVQGVYFVQPALSFEPGATVDCELHLPAKAGTLKFKRAVEKNADPLRPDELVVQSVKSETLGVKVDEKLITVDAITPKKAAADHVLKITIALPNTESPKLHMIDAWLARGNGGGNGVTRGLWIEAKGEKAGR